MARSASSQAVLSVQTRSLSSSNGIRGFGSRKWRLGGISPWWTARAALISPITPAAASRWPRFVFTEPTANGAERCLP